MLFNECHFECFGAHDDYSDSEEDEVLGEAIDDSDVMIECDESDVMIECFPPASNEVLEEIWQPEEKRTKKRRLKRRAGKTRRLRSTAETHILKSTAAAQS